MNARGSVNILNVVLVLVVLIVLAAVLFPLYVGSVYDGYGPLMRCMSQLRQVGQASVMYCDDWHAFPTNRPWSSKGKLGSISSRVKLSPCISDPHAKNERFSYGINWVESLCPYIKQKPVPTEYRSVWRCRVAMDTGQKPGSGTAAVTYAFNRNLVERSPEGVHSPARLMMIREMDRLVDAELRPKNDSRWTSKHPPISPLLTKPLHRNGSVIVFADGHAQWQKTVEGRPRWDPTTRRWYALAHSQSTAISP